MSRLPRPATWIVFYRLGIKVERTDYTRGTVYDITLKRVFVSVGKRHFRLCVWWGK